MERLGDNDVKEYTIRNLKSEIVLLEEHYREFIAQKHSPDKILVCKDCLEKHLLAIRGYIGEALKYFPDNRLNWNEIKVWVDTRLDELPKLECETDEQEKHINDIISELKEVRLKTTSAAGKPCYSCQRRAMGNVV